MKKIFLALFLMPLLCQAQTKVSVTTQVTPKVKIALVIPQNQIFKLDKVKDTILTTNKAIYQGVEYPVYAIKATGKMYICLTSKSGKYYRKYIKQE